MLEPVFHWIGASITTFHGASDGHASSLAHDLMDLWLSRALGPPEGDVATAYDRLAIVFDSPSLWDTQMQVDAAKLVLHFLRVDTASLPVATINRYLRSAMDLTDDDATVLRLVLEGALSALRSGHGDYGQREMLADITRDALSAMKNGSQPTALLAWVILHNDGGVYAHLFNEPPSILMDRIIHSPLRDTHPELLKQASMIMADKYQLPG